MNKYFSKALFYAEKKNFIYSMLAYSLVYVFGLVYLIGTLSTAELRPMTTPPAPSLIFADNFLLFIAIALTTVIYSYLEKDKKYYFMLTQTYSRDSIIITKTVTYLLSYTIPTIIYGTISYIIVSLNKSYYNSSPWGNNYNFVVSRIFSSIIGTIAVLTFLALTLQFLQMCFGKCISAIIIPAIIVMLSSLSFSLMGQFISRKLGPLRDFWHYINNLQFYTGPDGLVQYRSLQQIVYEYLNNFDIAVSLILLIIAAVLFYISILLNRRIKAENTSNIFLFKPAEVTFKVVFSLFITIAASLLFAGILYYLSSSVVGLNYSTYLIQKHGLTGKENIEHTIYLVLNILWIPLFALVYKVFSFIMNKRRVV